MDKFIQLYLYVLFNHAEEIASGLKVEIDVKDEPLLPSLECDQVCSVFFMTLMFNIDFLIIIYLSFNLNVNKYQTLQKFKYL